MSTLAPVVSRQRLPWATDTSMIRRCHDFEFAAAHPLPKICPIPLDSRRLTGASRESDSYHFEPNCAALVCKVAYRLRVSPTPVRGFESLPLRKLTRRVAIPRCELMRPFEPEGTEVRPEVTLYRWRMQGSFLLRSSFGSRVSGEGECGRFAHDRSFLFGSCEESSLRVRRPNAVERLGCELPLD
jgi:hypothetical protein